MEATGLQGRSHGYGEEESSKEGGEEGRQEEGQEESQEGKEVGVLQPRQDSQEIQVTAGAGTCAGLGHSWEHEAPRIDRAGNVSAGWLLGRTYPFSEASYSQIIHSGEHTGLGVVGWRR